MISDPTLAALYHEERRRLAQALQRWGRPVPPADLPWQELVRLAHSLKGAAAAVADEATRTVAERLERWARDLDPAHLEPEHRNALPRIAQWLLDDARDLAAVTALFEQMSIPAREVAENENNETTRSVAFHELTFDPTPLVRSSDALQEELQRNLSSFGAELRKSPEERWSVRWRDASVAAPEIRKLLDLFAVPGSVRDEAQNTSRSFSEPLALKRTESIPVPGETTPTSHSRWEIFPENLSFAPPAEVSPSQSEPVSKPEPAASEAFPHWAQAQVLLHAQALDQAWAYVFQRLQHRSKALESRQVWRRWRKARQVSLKRWAEELTQRWQNEPRLGFRGGRVWAQAGAIPDAFAWRLWQAWSSPVLPPEEAQGGGAGSWEILLEVQAGMLLASGRADDAVALRTVCQRLSALVASLAGRALPVSDGQQCRFAMAIVPDVVELFWLHRPQGVCAVTCDQVVAFHPIPPAHAFTALQKTWHVVTGDRVLPLFLFEEINETAQPPWEAKLLVEMRSLEGNYLIAAERVEGPDVAALQALPGNECSADSPWMALAIHGETLAPVLGLTQRTFSAHTR